MLTPFNLLSSMTLAGVGQQLVAISTGINDLPTNIAKALTNAGTTFATPGPSSSALASRVKPLPQLDRNDFPNIIHWERAIYKRLRKTAKKDRVDEDGGDYGHGDPKDIEAKVAAISAGLAAAGVSVTSCYMEDSDGNQIPQDQKTNARNTAKRFWVGLTTTGDISPAKLGKLDDNTRNRFVACMEQEFPWLRYCQGHWKAEQIWINHYSSWSKNFVAGVAIKTEVNSDEEADEEDQRKAPKRPQEDGQTSKSKRPRVDEKGPPRPVPTKTATERVRVRVFTLMVYMSY